MIKHRAVIALRILLGFAPYWASAADDARRRARQLFGDCILLVDGYAAYKGLIKEGGRRMH